MINIKRSVLTITAPHIPPIVTHNMLNDAEDGFFFLL